MNVITILPGDLVFDGVDYFIFIESRYTDAKYNCVWARLCVDTRRITGVPVQHTEEKTTVVCQTNVVVAMRFHDEYSILSPVDGARLTEAFYGRATCRRKADEKKKKTWGKVSRIVECAYVGPELFGNNNEDYERYLFANHFKDAKEPLPSASNTPVVQSESMTFLELFLRKLQQTEAAATSAHGIDETILANAIAKQCAVLAIFLDV